MVWVVIVFHVLGFISSIDAVMSTRTAQGAVAWAVSLNAFPYLAVPAYWVLGRSKFEGYVSARQEGDLEIEHIAKLADENTLHLRSTRSEHAASSSVSRQLNSRPSLSFMVKLWSECWPRPETASEFCFG